MRIAEVRLTSWGQLKQRLLPELVPGDALPQGGFLFRGVADENWALTASLDRLRPELPVGPRMAMLRATLAALRSEHLLATGRELVGDDVELQTLGQHYGLPTRLLDWSESPYVAAYFAFEGLMHGTPGPGRHAALWALARDDPAWSGDSGCGIVSAYDERNERSRAQRGHFTHLRAAVDSLEEYVARLPSPGTALWKFVVPAAEAPAALSDLELMGLSGRTLFPGLTGLTRAAVVKAACAGLA